jgi:hypothetical protein
VARKPSIGTGVVNVFRRRDLSTAVFKLVVARSAVIGGWLSTAVAALRLCCQIQKFREQGEENEELDSSVKYKKVHWIHTKTNYCRQLRIDD